MESAEMMLPFRRAASSTETAVLPVAVGPAMMTRGFFASAGAKKELFEKLDIKSSILIPV